jgi:hypothetical protein
MSIPFITAVKGLFQRGTKRPRTSEELLQETIGESRRTHKSTRDAYTHQMATFAQASYGDNVQDKLNLLQTNLPNAEEWFIDENLSDQHRTVFVNNREQHVVTSFRGTADFQDIAQDVLIATGMQSLGTRFKNETNRYNDVYDKYARYKQSLASHSLGGALNQAVNQQYDLDEVHNFNTGSGFGDILKQMHNIDHAFDSGKGHGHITNYHVFGDVISAHQYTNPNSTNYVFDKKPETSTGQQQSELFDYINPFKVVKAAGSDIAQRHFIKQFVNEPQVQVIPDLDVAQKIVTMPTSSGGLLQ